MMSSHVPSASVTALDPSAAFTVVLRAESDGAELGREPVTREDLGEVFSEAWREGCLRQGRPDLALEDADIQLFPLFDDDSRARCVGFELLVRALDGRTTRCPFSLLALEPVAERLIERLRAAASLSGHTKVRYEVWPTPGRVAAPAAQRGEQPSIAAVKKATLAYLQIPLRPLLDRSRQVNAPHEGVFPVFYTEQTLARTETCARRGDRQHPPVETGAVLLGSLCSCPETGEFFCIITDALAVEDADQSVFALAYSGRSWQRIRAVLKAKQASQPGRADRLLGQAHGHNYRPNDGNVCEQCHSLPTCNLTNIFASQDDHLWSRAVFVRQPWQLCHIFGWSARGDRHHGLFTLQGGRLRDRGFHVLPDFDFNSVSDAWPGQSAPTVQLPPT